MTTEGKPNICFLIGGREGGGAANATLWLLQRIDRSKFTVRVAVCDDGPFTSRIEAEGQPCDRLGTGWPPNLRRQTRTDISVAPAGYWRSVSWLRHTVGRFKRYLRREQIDLVHTNYHHYHIVGAAACRVAGVMCLWHWHLPLEQPPKLQDGREPHPGKRLRPDPRWAVIRAFSPLVRTLMRNRSWSIANSRATADSIRPIVGDRIDVIYNGLPLENLRSEGGRLREILGLPDATIVGFVGSMQPRKGHIHFLEAAHSICPRYQNVHFVYIGGQTVAREQDYHDFILRKRTEFGLEDRVHFLGSRSDAAELTAGFDIATVCSLPPGEGFGLVITEAMAHGVPVVSSSTGAAVELIEHGKTGILVPAADSGALADAIEDLLGDAEKRRSIGEAGRVRCFEEYDMRKTTRRIETLYERLLTERRRSINADSRIQ
ncbi:MAG: glycosyltransferase [Phycisphaerae bacterium]|nr:glycosyltransferase [Phycisphaerae bacterium]